MNRLLEWLYFRRDPVSYFGTVLLVIVLAASLGKHPLRADSNTPVEMSVMLEAEQLSSPEPSTPELPVTAPPEQVTPVVPVNAVAEARLPESIVPVESAPSTPAIVPQPVATSTQSAQTSLPAPSESHSIKAAASAQYEAQILAYLERVKRYPTSREARLTRPTGITRIWFELNRSGELLGSGIASSSGSNLLDAEAIRSVRTGSFPHFPESAYQGEAAHRFIATLTFDIGGVQSSIAAR